MLAEDVRQSSWPAACRCFYRLDLLQAFLCTELLASKECNPPPLPHHPIYQKSIRGGIVFLTNLKVRKIRKTQERKQQSLKTGLALLFSQPLSFTPVYGGLY